MTLGTTMLGRRHVLPSVSATLHEIQVEGTFPSGTYLVTVHNPIATDDGDLARALYGSFLPVPDQAAFPPADAAEYEPDRRPGAVRRRRRPSLSTTGPRSPAPARDQPRRPPRPGR